MCCPATINTILKNELKVVTTTAQHTSRLEFPTIYLRNLRATKLH